MLLDLTQPKVQSITLWDECGAIIVCKNEWGEKWPLIRNGLEDDNQSCLDTRNDRSCSMEGVLYLQRL